MERPKKVLNPDQTVQGFKIALDLLARVEITGKEVPGFNIAHAAITDALNEVTAPVPLGKKDTGQPK